MGLVPRLTTSCCCCSLKTGSFVIAILILVGSSVQTGFYAFMVDHIHPQKMCTVVYYERVHSKNEFPDRRFFDYDFYDSFLGDDLFPFANRSDPSYGEVAANNTHVGDWLWRLGWRHSINPWRRRFKRALRRFSPFPGPRYEEKSYERPCVRDHRPFEVDNNSLDYDQRRPFDRSILYFNIVIWAAMMAATPLLMMGVYKESAGLVWLWMATAALLLLVAAASALGAAAILLQAVPVSIGIVLLLNTALYLGIDIYFLMVVFNYHRQLTAKVSDETEDEQVTV